MRLYLLRHGEPQPVEKDPQQQLTPRGRLDIAIIARFLEQSGVYLNEIWYSPSPRVRETAEIIAPAVGSTQMVAMPELAPLEPPGPIRAEIMGREEDLFLVGHLPFLPRLVSLLLGCPHDRPILRFEPGDLVVLERESVGVWRLFCAISPQMLE